MIIVLNNKCHFNKEEFLSYQDRLSTITSNHQMVLCPSNIYLSTFHLPHFSLGAQNVSRYPIGSYTGEVSSSQLKSLGVSYALVGHSERRFYFKESDDELKDKIKNLLEDEITPILCVGQMSKEEEVKKVQNQLEFLKQVENSEKVIIAYEPVWAIGSGNIPTIEEIEEVVQLIKEQFPHHQVIYGGSVNEENIENLKTDLLDGYLLGGLSLHPDRLRLFLSKLNY